MPSRRDARRPARTPVRTRPGSGRDGTTRRRTSAPAPKASRTRSAGEPRAARGLTGRAVVVLLVLGALMVSYAQSLRVWFDQHQQITSLTDEIRDREQRVGQLQDEIARWNDDAYVRAQARQRLGWVMPGEVGYRVIGPDGKPLGPSESPAGPAALKHDPAWYAKLWGSVQVAGAKAK